MDWKTEMHDEAQKELLKLDNSIRQQVIKAIDKVSQNPLPSQEGGYGKTLRNASSSKLAGCCKIKLVKCGYRIVYKPIREGNIMKIIIISIRADDEVYKEAEKRL